MKKIAVLFVWFAFTIISSAQKPDFSLSWGQKERFSNGKDGYITDFVGKNSKYIYAYYSNGGVGYAYKGDDYSKLVAFDCQTLERAFVQPIKGYKENKETKLLKDIRYDKTVVFADAIYVFWIGSSNKTKQIYVSSYDLKLNPIAPLKKIFEAEKQNGDDISPEVIVKFNKNGHILIGAEKGTKENVNLKFAYRVIDSKLEFVASKEIELPISFDLKWWQTKIGLSSYYQLLDDDNLVITSNVRFDKSSTKKSKIAEPDSYAMISIVSILTGDTKVIPLKFSGKNTNEITVKSDGKTVSIYGTYWELNEDEDGSLGKGIFTYAIDSKTLVTTQKAQFSRLSKAQLASLTNSNFAFNIYSCDILDIQKFENNTLIFLSNRQLYTVVPQSGVNKDYCINNDIYVVSVSDKGDINWVTFFDRTITYDQLNFSSIFNFSIKDIKVFRKDDKFLVIYDSKTYIDSKGKTRSKNYIERNSFEDYLILDPKNGTFKQAQIVVNPPNIKNKDAKHLSSGTSFFIDDQLYFYHKEIHLKTFVALTGWILIGAPYSFQGSRYGEGYIGKVNLIK